MLGLGEKETELFQTMDDLREVGCEVLTMGQYLRPSPKHLPVVEYITPEQFNYYGDIARRERFSLRRLGAAGPQLLSRGRFSSGCASVMASKRYFAVESAVLSGVSVRIRLILR